MIRVMTMALLLLALGGCGATPPGYEADQGQVTITVIGTNDTHGQLERVAVLSGYMRNIRAARETDGGAALLLSGGDMWQGTLESNLFEGASMVEAYNHVGYTAAAIGNHEFDYGPTGEHATPQGPEDARRGALMARVEEAAFPILSANFIERSTGEPVRWAGVQPYTVVEAAGLRIGVIGASTEETLETTISANVSDLRMASVISVVEQHARELRERGADLVLLAVHAGGHCESFEDPDDLSSCDPDEEIMGVARGLAPGLIDAIVGGHTHKAIAHRVNGIPILESYAHGRAFGRVDLMVDRRTRRLVGQRIYPPHDMCQTPNTPAEECEPGEYAGAPVEVDRQLLERVDSYLQAARERRDEPLGIEVSSDITRAYDEESPLGNLLADLMLEAREADVAMINGGGVRAEIPAGPLTYGALYRTFPFDNRFATVRISGAELAQLIARNLGADGGILLFSGIRAVAECRSGELEVALHRPDGRTVDPDEDLRLVASDFLVTTSDPTFVQASSRGDVEIEDGPPIREVLAAHLRATGGTLSGQDVRLFDPASLRVRYDGPRPVQCE